MTDRRSQFALADARKAFSGVVAVDGVDIQIESGTVHALIGENGAGKSTAARMLAGVYSPTSGSVRVDGSEVAFSSALQAEGRGIVMIPQELQIFPSLSVAENLFAARRRPRRFGVFDRREILRRSSAALARLGLSVSPSALVGDLPYGARQIVSIARALMSDVRLLIMDEPTAALDEWESRRLLEIVSELRRDGVAVLYVSHRLHEVTAIADRITVMRDGRVVSTGPAVQYDRDSMVEQMVGRRIELTARPLSHATDDVALAVDALSRRGEFRDVSLSVRRGEVVGLAGIVGSGRSELALAIAGRTRADSGSVRIGEQAIGRSVLQGLTAGLGFVPEERQAQGLFLGLDVTTNVTVLGLDSVRRGGLLSRRRETGFAADAMRRFRFTRRGSDVVATLSGGNQQKVLLARILSAHPSVLILDEPTRGIDVGARAEIYETIDGLAARGTAILVISSDMQEILLLSDRVLVMQSGAVVAELEGDDRTELKIGEAALVHVEDAA